MDGFTGLAKALKGASFPAILIFGGLYGLGLTWPVFLASAGPLIAFIALTAGVLWTIGIGVGRLTGSGPLARLERKSPPRALPPKPKQPRLPKS